MEPEAVKTAIGVGSRERPAGGALSAMMLAWLLAWLALLWLSF